MSFIEILDKVNSFKFDFLKPKPDIDFLKNYLDKNIIMVGYEIWETNLDTISIKNFYENNENIKKYNLAVIHPKINNYNRKTINDCLNFCKNNKVDCIFYGYNSFVNLNLDNSKMMFRPINIEKYPFNVKNSKIINKNFAWYYLIKYILLLFLLIYINIKKKKTFYRLLLVIIIILGFLIPRKHIVYINNV